MIVTVEIYLEISSILCSCHPSVVQKEFFSFEINFINKLRQDNREQM